MTYQDLAKQLIESGADERVSTFHNRLLLRIFSSPSLQSFLYDVKIQKVDDSDGEYLVQVDFLKLPREIIPQVKLLLATPSEPEIYDFNKNGSAHTGFQFTLKPSDFPEDTNLVF